MEKEKYELISNICESKLISNKNKLRNYTIRDIADFAFLYVITLVIFSKDYSTKNEAQRYIDKTISYGNFDNFMFSQTDLYIFFHILMGSKSQDTISYLRQDKRYVNLKQHIKLTPHVIRSFLANLSANRASPDLIRRILMWLQNNLHIENSNYKSIRTLVSNWDSVSDWEKKLVITRLMQAYRARMIHSELLKPLENLSKSRELYIKGASNPETGKIGTIQKKAEKKPLIPDWAKLPLVGIGAVALGYHLGKKKQ